MWDIRTNSKLATVPVYEAVEGVVAVQAGMGFPGEPVDDKEGGKVRREGERSGCKAGRSVVWGGRCCRWSRQSLSRSAEERCSEEVRQGSGPRMIGDSAKGGAKFSSFPLNLSKLRSCPPAHLSPTLQPRPSRSANANIDHALHDTRTYCLELGLLCTSRLHSPFPLTSSSRSALKHKGGVLCDRGQQGPSKTMPVAFQHDLPPCLPLPPCLEAHERKDCVLRHCR